MSSLKIVLGDLTYTAVALSTDAMPLNIGYIAAYCQKIYKSRVEIELFKYINELDKDLHTYELDVLGLSNYCWNE